MWTASPTFSKTAKGVDVQTLSKLCRKAETATLDTEKAPKSKGQTTHDRATPRRKPLSCEL